MYLTNLQKPYKIKGCGRKKKFFYDKTAFEKLNILFKNTKAGFGKIKAVFKF